MRYLCGIDRRRKHDPDHNAILLADVGEIQFDYVHFVLLLIKANYELFGDDKDRFLVMKENNESN